MTPLLPIPAAALVLAVSPATLRGWVSAGRVPYRKLGGCVRFTQEDLNAIIRDAYRPPRQPEPSRGRVAGGEVKWGVPRAEWGTG